MLTEEDINKIAKKVVEIQEQKGVKNILGKCTVADVIDKYHNQFYDKFGTTGQIQNAIRTVAVYKCGVRYIAQIPEEKFEDCRNYAEKLCKDILEE